MKLLVIIIGMLFSQAFVYAQDMNSARILRQRINRINLFHVGIGADYATNYNTVFGARGYIGIGSSRHLFNADLGLGIRFWNLFSESKKSHYSMVQVPFFISSTFHPIRWSNGCLYAGGEALTLFGIRNLSNTISDNHNAHDSKTLRNYVSVRGKFGVVFHSIDVGLFFEHDFAPMCDQKSIYESGLYDFGALRESIYERDRIGLSISYLFNL